MTNETTQLISFTDRLSDKNRECIIATVTESMRSNENAVGGAVAWKNFVGPDENVLIGQLTHPDENRRMGLSQAVLWYHPDGQILRRLDSKSREQLLNLWYDAAEQAWSNEAGTVLSEGFSQDELQFDPAELRHNFFAYAGTMINALQQEKLLPEVVQDQTEEVIKHLPLFERVFANIRRVGSAEEIFNVDNLGQLIQSMMPKIDIPGFDFSVQTSDQSDGIGVSISLGRHINKTDGFFKQATGETVFQGIKVGFTLGAENGRLKAIRVPNYNDSTVPGIVKNALVAAALAAKFLGVKRDVSLEGIKQTLIGKLTNPQQSLEEILKDSFERRGLVFNGLKAVKNSKQLVLTFNGKVK